MVNRYASNLCRHVTDNVSDDPTLDEEYDGANDDTWFASRRSPIARSAKKRVQYEEDVATEDYDDYDEPQYDGGGGAAVEATLDLDVEGGVALNEQSAAATPIAGGELSDAVDQVAHQVQQQDFKPHIEPEVVDLCDSDDEVRTTLPPARKTHKSASSGRKMEEEPMAETQKFVKVEKEAESLSEQVHDDATTSSRPYNTGTPSSGNRSAEMLRKRKQLELERRNIQLQMKEVEVDRKLLELED